VLVEDVVLVLVVVVVVVGIPVILRRREFVQVPIEVTIT
jgi:hypothetical protein